MSNLDTNTDSTPRRVKSAVFHHSINQTREWLKRSFQAYSGKELLVAQVSNLTSLRQAENEFNQPDGNREKLAYPFCLMALGDITLDTDRAGSKKNHANRGYIAQRDLRSHTAEMHNLRPVVVSLGLSFRTDNLDQVLDMAHVFLMSHPAVRFVLRVGDELRVYNRLELPASFSTPPMDSQTAGEAYMFETVIMLRTYLGDVFDHRLIANIRYERYDADDPTDPFFTQEEGNVRLVSFQDYYDRTKHEFNSSYGEPS